MEALLVRARSLLVSIQPSTFKGMLDSTSKPKQYSNNTADSENGGRRYHRRCYYTMDHSTSLFLVSANTRDNDNAALQWS